MDREDPDEPDGAPTGLPEDAEEATPLGPPHTDPDGEDGERERGPGAMPGIPDGGEPPSSG
jgi:hypothetical protein